MNNPQEKVSKRNVCSREELPTILQKITYLKIYGWEETLNVKYFLNQVY